MKTKKRNQKWKYKRKENMAKEEESVKSIIYFCSRCFSFFFFFILFFLIKIFCFRFFRYESWVIWKHAKLSSWSKRVNMFWNFKIFFVKCLWHQCIEASVFVGYNKYSIHVASKILLFFFLFCAPKYGQAALIKTI